MSIWYLWAKNGDPVTNEYFVKVIGEQNPEYGFAKRLCADGRKRNLFMCPDGYANVQDATTAISKFNLKMEVFKQEIDDRIVRYDLWKQKPRKRACRSAVHRKMQAHLDQRQHRVRA